jgi:hypothetical protein
MGGKGATVVIDDEVSRDVRTIGGVRTPESLTNRKAAIAGYIGVSPPSPSLSQDRLGKSASFPAVVLSGVKDEDAWTIRHPERYGVFRVAVPSGFR